MTRHITLSIFILFILCTHLVANTIYVDIDNQAGSNNGTSWANSYLDLQDALAAADHGDTIWVAKGIYLPTQASNRFFSFNLKSGVRMFGGFAGGETALQQRDWQAHHTILSGDIGVLGDISDNSYTVVYANFLDSTTVFDGFWVSGGNANDASGTLPTGLSKSGGGMYLLSASQTEESRPLIRNCTFTNNQASNFGGAIYIVSKASGSVTPYISHCIFQGNTAQNGGGVYKSGSSQLLDMRMDSCSFFSNFADYGAGVSINHTFGTRYFEFVGCQFVNNNFTLDGGGIHIEHYTSPSDYRFSGCLFEGNVGTINSAAAAIGGFTFTEPAFVVIDSCDFVTNISADVIELLDFRLKIGFSKFIGNTKINSGSGCIANGDDTNITNSLFDSNTFPVHSVGVFVASAKLTFSGLTITRNSNNLFNVIFFNPNPTNAITNSIIYGNFQSPDDKIVNGFLSFEHTLVDVPDCESVSAYPITCGPGMLYNQDPMFVDPFNNDFRLAPCSPARNAGDNAIVAQLGLLTDIAGNPRIQGGTVDMGAYESPAFAVDSVAVTMPACGSSATAAVQFAPAHGCAPYTYAWSDGTNTGTGTDGLAPGSYAFTVTDALGHQALAQVEVPAAPPITATATATPYNCTSGTGGSASLSASGGTGPFSYLWETADTTAALQDLAPGTYTATITDGLGCTATTTATVGLTGQLLLAFSFLQEISCHDSNDGTVEVQPGNGTAPFTWQWQGGQTDSVLTGLGGGSYTVTVTDTLGCEGGLDFTITAPDTLQVAVSATDVQCSGNADGTATATPTGGTPGYNYLWDNGQMTATITNLAPGPHPVTVTDSNGCTDTASVTIASPTELLVETMVAIGNDTLCPGGSATLSALPSGGTAPYIYMWDGGWTDSLLIVETGGTYTVAVTDAHHCGATQSIDIVAVAPVELDTAIVNASGPANPDGAVFVNGISGGVPPSSFLWSNGAITQSIENVLPGAYSLTLTDGAGCQHLFSYMVDFETATDRAERLPFRATVVPNPSPRERAAVLRIEADRHIALTVSVLDAAGRVLTKEKVASMAGMTEWPLPTGLAAGAYRAVLLDGEGGQVVVGFSVF